MAWSPYAWGAPGVQKPAEDGSPWRMMAEQRSTVRAGFPCPDGRFAGLFDAPPAGFEPALTAPEAVALSPELWGPGRRTVEAPSDWRRSNITSSGHLPRMWPNQARQPPGTGYPRARDGGTWTGAGRRR